MKWNKHNGLEIIQLLTYTVVQKLFIYWQVEFWWTKQFILCNVYYVFTHRLHILLIYSEVYLILCYVGK